MKALKSELKKFFSLRSTLVYAVLLSGTVVGVATIYQLAWASTEPGVTRTISWEHFANGASIFTIIAIVMLGASCAGEVSSKMQAWAFMTQNHRSNWLAARLIIAIGFLAFCFGISIALALLTTVFFPEVTFANKNFANMQTELVTLAVYGTMAAALGIITGSKALAVSVPVLSLLVVEPLLYLLISFKPEVFGWISFATPLRRIIDIQTLNTYLAEGFPAEIGFNLAAGQFAPTWFNYTVLGAWTLVFIIAAYLVNAKKDAR